MHKHFRSHSHLNLGEGQPLEKMYCKRFFNTTKKVVQADKYDKTRIDAAVNIHQHNIQRCWHLGYVASKYSYKKKLVARLRSTRTQFWESKGSPNSCCLTPFRRLPFTNAAAGFFPELSSALTKSQYLVYERESVWEQKRSRGTLSPLAHLANNLPRMKTTACSR
jgi:hypothetical protein